MLGRLETVHQSAFEGCRPVLIAPNTPLSVFDKNDKPGAVLQALAGHGILGGRAVDGGILWCATEVVSKEEIDRAVAIIKEVC